MVKNQMSSGINENESKGRVEQWRILPEAPPIDYMVALRHDEENLTIILRPVEYHQRHLVIRFESALSFRNTQEGLFLNAVDAFGKKLWGTTFFKVSNSKFLRGFHENASWAFNDWEITHYAIYTSNFCVDILSVLEPSVSWEDDI